SAGRKSRKVTAQTGTRNFQAGRDAVGDRVGVPGLAGGAEGFFLDFAMAANLPLWRCGILWRDKSICLPRTSPNDHDTKENAFTRRCPLQIEARPLWDPAIPLGHFTTFAQ